MNGKTVKQREPILAQMEPVQWMKDAAEGARRSLSIKKGSKVNAVGVPECAHRPQRFQRKRGYVFVDQDPTSVSICEALPLPVLAPP